MVRRLISVQPNHRLGCKDDVQWGGLYFKFYSKDIHIRGQNYYLVLKINKDNTSLQAVNICVYVSPEYGSQRENCCPSQTEQTIFRRGVTLPPCHPVLIAWPMQIPASRPPQNQLVLTTQGFFKSL